MASELKLNVFKIYAVRLIMRLNYDIVRYGGESNKCI